MRRLSFLLFFTACGIAAQAQYAPQAGIAGSTAIAATSSQIVNWANGCMLRQGWLDIAQPALGFAQSGDSSLAVGVADNFVVSLGDSGVATLQFPAPVVNGPGADFVVFENGFTDPMNDEDAFLELAFVEASSDGNNFHRFPAVSMTPVETQIPGAGVYMNARLIHNLAGKYVSGFGTPFDLQDLSGTAGLDINHITHIRIIDVVGDVALHVSKDGEGRVINDPYPTAFPTGGFDLDAVGVIHQATTSVSDVRHSGLALFPNPAQDQLSVRSAEPVNLMLMDVQGKTWYSASEVSMQDISLRGFPRGMYFVRIFNKQGHQWTERFIKL